MGPRQSPWSLARSPGLGRMTDATLPERLDRAVAQSVARGAVFLCALDGANWMCQATNKHKGSTCASVAFSTIFRRSTTQGVKQETRIADSSKRMVSIQGLR